MSLLYFFKGIKMVNNKTIETEVICTLKKYIKDNGEDPARLSLKSNLIKDYNLDSLDYLNLFSILEEKFDIKIPNDMQNYDILLSVNDLVQYITSKKNE
jgi:acyl carrier protein